ncbi:U2 small nuclear ribonucleoprotein A' isoform X2 [Festucalex cinctus]
MVKLSAELIEQAAQYTNPVRDRELDLRGYKIPVLENLGATLDQFDTVDFSDNEVRKLDGFPLLKRLKTLLMNNNRICRIGENLEQSLPSLRELILTSNNIQELGDLEPLASVKTLSLLSLLRNPVTNKKHYRLYVIHKIPQIRVLDFQKVKLKVHARDGGAAGEEEDGPVARRRGSHQERHRQSVVAGRGGALERNAAGRTHPGTTRWGRRGGGRGGGGGGGGGRPHVPGGRSDGRGRPHGTRSSRQRIIKTLPFSSFIICTFWDEKPH